MLDTKNMPAVVTLYSPGLVTVVYDGAYFFPHSPSRKARMIDPRCSQIALRAVRINELAATVGPHRTQLSGPWRMTQGLDEPHAGWI